MGNFLVNKNNKIFLKKDRKTTLSMKTLIAYSTTHGCTEKTALELQSLSPDLIEMVNLKINPDPDLSEFDRIIIGGSIHAGKIQKRVKEFCQKNMEILISKELGLFICCMEEGETAQQQLENAYPEDLRNHAKATGCLGGEFDFERMNLLQKFIVRKVAHVDKSVSRINYPAINEFSNKMDKVFNPFLFLV